MLIRSKPATSDHPILRQRLAATAPPQAGTPDSHCKTCVSDRRRVMRARAYGEVQPAQPADATASAQQAVQVALDRRDNGGDAGSAGEK